MIELCFVYLYCYLIFTESGVTSNKHITSPLTKSSGWPKHQLLAQEDAGGPPMPCFLIGCLNRWPTPSEPAFDQHTSGPPSPCFLIGCRDRGQCLLNLLLTGTLARLPCPAF